MLLALLFFSTVLGCGNAAGPELIPQPQFYQPRSGVLDLSSAVIEDGDGEKIQIAREFLIREAASLGFTLGRSPGERRPTIELVDLSQRASMPLLEEEEEDRRVLAAHAEQGYVIRTDVPSGRVILAGMSAQGVLYAATTLAQLWRAERGRLLLPAVHVRDFPDFRYRAAADWLLLGEINRWAYDWGDGREKYLDRIKRKLDFALRFKINMIFFDGFGWNAERTPGYSRMMRQINAYARERGIKLIFGGYGYYFDARYLAEEHNIGKGYLNRHYYPDGPVYFCMPGDPMPRAGQETALRTHGTCRANDELLRLKVADLEEFVQSVEPGALYIHHEDHGDFEPTRQAWLYRCQYCRRRWPNDDLKASDGGAGALAHGYKALLQAVRRVKNTDTGYDAARDCTVTLISPVYRLREESPEDWRNVLDLWQSIVSLLPRDDNMQIGFREIFPQTQTGQRWMEAYRERMQAHGLLHRTFVFFLGGSQGYVNRYPFTASATLNGQFLGAETIYNFSGSVFQEPLQMLNGAFGWNANSAGRQEARGTAEIKRLWEALYAGRTAPDEVFGDSGFLGVACRKLYGAAAAGPMRAYFTYSEDRPGLDRLILPPHFTDRMAPLPVLFDALEQDSKFWVRRGPSDPVRAGKRTLAARDLHPLLAELWDAQARVNSKAASLVGSALAAGGMDGGAASHEHEDAREEIEYLKKCLETGRRFSTVLAATHRLLASGGPERRALLSEASKQLSDLDTWLHAGFHFDTVCPLGGEQSSWLDAVRRLRNLLNAESY